MPVFLYLSYPTSFVANKQHQPKLRTNAASKVSVSANVDPNPAQTFAGNVQSEIRILFIEIFDHISHHGNIFRIKFELSGFNIFTYLIDI